MSESYGVEVDFASWMMVGLPITVIMLPLTWFVLTRVVFKVDFKTSGEGRAELDRMRMEMGAITNPEKRIAIVFGLMALLWITRPVLSQVPGLSALDDSGIV